LCVPVMISRHVVLCVPVMISRHVVLCVPVMISRHVVLCSIVCIVVVLCVPVVFLLFISFILYLKRFVLKTLYAKCMRHFKPSDSYYGNLLLTKRDGALLFIVLGSLVTCAVFPCRCCLLCFVP